MASSNDTKRITDRAAQALKYVKGGRNYLSDSSSFRGLRLKAYKDGMKSWVYRYRHPADNTKLRQITLGSYPQMGLAEAHEEFMKVKKVRREGGDPLQERLDKKAAHLLEKEANKPEDYTVRQLVDDYLENHIFQNRKPQGAKEVARVLNKELAGLMDVKACHITPQTIKNLEMKIKARPAPVISGQLIRELKYAFQEAIIVQRLPKGFANPCQGLKPETSKQRLRYFDNDELRMFMRWLPTSGMSDSVRTVLWLMLLTGCRSGEIVSARWEHINLDAGTWWLGDTKTDVPRTVQLSRQAVAVFRTRIEPSNKKFVFPSPNIVDEHIRQRAVVWAVCNKRKSFATTKGKWTAHDLRRTVRTGVGLLSDDPSLVNQLNIIGECILGHSRKGEEGTYDLNRFEPQCRYWLQEWADHLDTLGASEYMPGAGE
ncbi:tyrosine-type recombinase/integrase [Aestuariirhabdus sp. Z084]|uniref:tyrosine-type recombinase/integrase n=1 Tax=Aestuariirhabdus haliotis TaxID=2918751 RepID=UPI00201B37D6|nr:site-specific integrase [Aestuariirhabdus haliotis]MCL6416352.1 tyrosine-type recombinase/integrase [Aestuariirhabdus haliotis]MCL6420341.1 tyrosine-type recombinase/integrase [Aestuariirhabdus haliotis]